MRLVHINEDAYYAIGVPMETVGWTLLAAYSQADAELPVRQLEEDYKAIQLEAVTSYRSKSASGKTTVWILMAAVLTVMLTGALILSKRIVKPLNTITRRISELSETNLEFRMEDAFKTGDEVEELAESFAQISHKTVEYLDTVKRVTAEKERIGTELALATQIQEGMLPHIVPAFPDRKDFDIINAEQELFGTERMMAALNADPDAAPMDVLKNVRRAVDGFVKNAEQFDDLTMLCLEYKGPQARQRG